MVEDEVVVEVKAGGGVSGTFCAFEEGERMRDWADLTADVAEFGLICVPCWSTSGKRPFRTRVEVPRLLSVRFQSSLILVMPSASSCPTPATLGMLWRSSG